MNEEEIKKMEDAGFMLCPEVSVGNLWFERDITHPRDIKRVVDHLYPHHFHATSNRGVFAAHMYDDDATKDFWYVTSNLSGEYRQYRGRNFYNAKFGNIFGSGKTLAQAVDVFLKNYKEWIA